MERREKIYLPKISRTVDWSNFQSAAKDFAASLLPIAKRLCLFGFVAAVLLVLQIFTVGIFDRLGVSPKISITVSSLFYAAVFASLAIYGGVKHRVIVIASGANFNPPICKRLIIRKIVCHKQVSKSNEAL